MKILHAELLQVLIPLTFLYPRVALSDRGPIAFNWNKIKQTKCEITSVSTTAFDMVKKICETRNVGNAYDIE